MAAGGNFQSELGVLFRSKDVGATWERIDMGFEANSTMFGVAFDEHQRGRMYCATNGGQVFGSLDRENPGTPTRCPMERPRFTHWPAVKTGSRHSRS